MSSNTSITMPAVSWDAVRLLLNEPGWANTPKDIFLAGGILESGKLKLPERPTPNQKNPEAFTKAEDNWNRKAIKIDLMGKEVDTITKAVRHAIQNGKVGAGFASKAIVESFCKDDI